MTFFKNLPRLHMNELEREMHVTRKSGSMIPKLEQEKAELMRLYREKRKEAKQLSKELGTYPEKEVNLHIRISTKHGEVAKLGRS